MPRFLVEATHNKRDFMFWYDKYTRRFSWICWILFTIIYPIIFRKRFTCFKKHVVFICQQHYRVWVNFQDKSNMIKRANFEYVQDIFFVLVGGFVSVRTIRENEWIDFPGMSHMIQGAIGNVPKHSLHPQILFSLSFSFWAPQLDYLLAKPCPHSETKSEDFDVACISQNVVFGVGGGQECSLTRDTLYSFK